MNPDLGHWLNYQYEDNRDYCIKSDLDITQKDKDYMDDLLPWLFEQLEPDFNGNTILDASKIHVLVSSGDGRGDVDLKRGAWHKNIHCIPDSDDMLTDTMNHINPMLEPYGIQTYWPSVICTAGNRISNHIHVDGGKLEARLNFYSYQGSPGSIMWFPLTQEMNKLDDGTLTDSPHNHPKAVEMNPWWKYKREGGEDWDQVPDPVYCTNTQGLVSAWINTNSVHTVANGGGVRITPSLRVRNIDRSEFGTDGFNHTGTWNKVLEFLDGN